MADKEIKDSNGSTIATAALQANGSKVSMFIDPDTAQVEASAAIGALMVELHTGKFANTLGEERAAETARLITAAQRAHAHEQNDRKTFGKCVAFSMSEIVPFPKKSTEYIKK